MILLKTYTIPVLLILFYPIAGARSSSSDPSTPSGSTRSSGRCSSEADAFEDCLDGYYHAQDCLNCLGTSRLRCTTGSICLKPKDCRCGPCSDEASEWRKCMLPGCTIDCEPICTDPQVQTCVSTCVENKIQTCTQNIITHCVEQCIRGEDCDVTCVESCVESDVTSCIESSVVNCERDCRYSRRDLQAEPSETIG